MKIKTLYADEHGVFNIGNAIQYSSWFVSEIKEYGEFYEVRYENSKLVSRINKSYVFQVDLTEEE